MKKIMIIIPPYFNIEEYLNSKDLNIKKPVFTIPYGVLSILAYIKKYVNDMEAEILDLNVVIYDLCHSDIDYSEKINEIIEKKNRKIQSRHCWNFSIV